MSDLKESIKRGLPVGLFALISRVNRKLRRDDDQKASDRLYRRIGRPTVVARGPFRGMRYLGESTGSAMIPKLLGTYELELHPAIESLVASRPGLVVDVGAAEGYYAVGLARRLEGARIVSFDTDQYAQYLQRRLAALNGVGDRVEVRGHCTAEGLDGLLEGATNPLVICDCEGFEEDLLDPARAPALAGATILVELHDFLRPGVSGRIRGRFAGSHEIEAIATAPRSPADCPVALDLPPGDLLEALSEWRPGPMEWFLMRPRARPGAG